MDRIKKMFGFEINRDDSSREKNRKKDLGSEQIKFWSDVTTSDGKVRTIAFDDIEITGKGAAAFHSALFELADPKTENPEQSIVISISGCSFPIEFRVGSILGKLTRNKHLDLTIVATKEQSDALAKMHAWNPEKVLIVTSANR